MHKRPFFGKITSPPNSGKQPVVARRKMSKKQIGYPGGRAFPGNHAFRKLYFARCLKKWQPFGLHDLLRNISGCKSVLIFSC